MRRTAVPHGQWHLWIYCCNWTLNVNGTNLASSESDNETIDRALRVLSGQAITGVHVNDNGQSRFDFDLGCKLETTSLPKDNTSTEPDEQWMLYQPDGRVLTLRDDGTYQNEAGATGSNAPWLRPSP